MSRTKFVRRLVALAASALMGGALLAVVGASPAVADYGPGTQYQVEISFNEPGPTGGGFWLWFALTPDQQVQNGGVADYAGSDCGHGGVGAFADRGDTTWVQDGPNLVIGTAADPVTTGLGPATITVPATYGHTHDVTVTLLDPPPGFPPALVMPAPGWSSQVQIAP